MLPVNSPGKKPRSPQDGLTNNKTSITCSNVPEVLFDANTAKKHFGKFGRVQKIRLVPKRQMCVVEYEQPSSVERAVLNAGAFDGFMFDVTRSKNRVRRKSKKDDDPDWVPDSDVWEELNAMRGAPSYRISRQKPMDITLTTSSPETQNKAKILPWTPKQQLRKKLLAQEKQPISQSAGVIESPVTVTTVPTSLTTAEAAVELYNLRFKVSLTPDEQWRTLDARDRILRGWGGAGSRVKVGGATIGTCQDMCPEKELLHRQAEHQVMTLETVPGSDGQLEAWRAVKQYSRSSADQEMPMCYELRPAPVLMRTCSYLLREVADTTRQVSLADWFHFMWDRFRSIRKDITQQALCCSDSIRLVEICARFHAHCAARLADLEHTQFDQKLNTDNLTKCLQTLKHMYADVQSHEKPNEAEFRGYVALLNLGDSNFWWEIKQLPLSIQKSAPITFAIKIFNSIDNNNYVRFFRLIRDNATYLQACILLRYFNDVRARALARIVKAYAPRGGSRYPAEDLMNALAFESIENMKSFINHYGLRLSKSFDTELTIILDRNQFIEDSDPYPTARAINLIESKRKSSVGEVISGYKLDETDYSNQILYSSFKNDGKLKDTALVAEEQGYNTVNDTNKDIQALKAEILRLSKDENDSVFVEQEKVKADVIITPEVKLPTSKYTYKFIKPVDTINKYNQFSFKPAIPVAPIEVLNNSPEGNFAGDLKHQFSFSNPHKTIESKSILIKDPGNLFASTKKVLFESKPLSSTKNIFEQTNLLHTTKAEDTIIKTGLPKSIFGISKVEKKHGETSKSVFSNVVNTNIFKQSGDTVGNVTAPVNNIFSVVKKDQGIFSKPDSNKDQGIFLKSDSNKDQGIFSKSDSSVKFDGQGNIFSKTNIGLQNDGSKNAANIFGSFNKTTNITETIFFKKPDVVDGPSTSIFGTNGDTECIKLSPSSVFKNASIPLNITDTKTYSIFQSKNKAQSVADNILNSIAPSINTVHNYLTTDEETKKKEEERIKVEERIREEYKKQEILKKEQEHKQELKRQEEKRKEEVLRKQEELRKLKEKREKEEQKRKEELKKKMEEERKAEIKKKEEANIKFKERVETESSELVEELLVEINRESINEILKEELDNFNSLISYSKTLSEEILIEVFEDICYSEVKAENFRKGKLLRKWFSVWRKQLTKNLKRRSLLEDTPVWLTEHTPVEEANILKRQVENAALSNMNAFHRGYKFTGELRQQLSPDPYNIMEIIKSSLLKRMRQISYPYDKCFFWKVTIVSPGAMKWVHRKIDIEKWLLDVFSDKKLHSVSNTLINVTKQSWNKLIDFAISVSMINPQNVIDSGEALQGTNGVLFYFTEKSQNISKTIKETLKHKYPYQLIPVAVVLAKTDDDSLYNSIQLLLSDYTKKKYISDFKIYELSPQKIAEYLNSSTKSALRWMARRCPKNPSLEIDILKSLCQRYLGNEIWSRLKSDRDSRMKFFIEDLNKMIKYYNAAVDEFITVITNEDNFNYPTFPMEFNQFLSSDSPYPKPYEFIPMKVKNMENNTAIKEIINQLKLPNAVEEMSQKSVINMQQQILRYGTQIGWWKNCKDIVCSTLATQNEISDYGIPHPEFTNCFAQNVVDFLNFVVYEKINCLKKFNNLFAIYDKSVLEDYRNLHWLYDIDVFSSMKHKVIDYKDELDCIIEAKRRKIADDSTDLLMLEEKDSTLVEKSIKVTDKSISILHNCTEAMKQLEQQIENEKIKSMQLENLLKQALMEY